MRIIKLPAVLVAFAVLSEAGLVNGISIIVNKEPITLYEIHRHSQIYKVGKAQAVDMLIQEKIEDLEIKKRGIDADMFDVESQIDKIAKQNKMNSKEFLDLLRDKGVRVDEYKKDIQNKVKREKLYEKIAIAKMNKIDDEELKRYYENNKKEFEIAQNFEVIQYESSSKEAIEQIRKNPMQNSGLVLTKEIVLSAKEISPKLLFILNETPEGSATSIFSSGQGYAFFFIKAKKDKNTLSFDDVKNQIFGKIASQKEESVIKEYFDKLKAEAKIEIIREP